MGVIQKVLLIFFFIEIGLPNQPEVDANSFILENMEVNVSLVNILYL